jgi:hypothetical protein
MHSAAREQAERPPLWHFVVTQGIDAVEKFRQPFLTAIWKATAIALLLFHLSAPGSLPGGIIQSG